MLFVTDKVTFVEAGTKEDKPFDTFPAFAVAVVTEMLRGEDCTVVVAAMSSVKMLDEDSPIPAAMY